MLKRSHTNIPRLISVLEKHIVLGYTHENYREAAKLFGVLSRCVEPCDSRLLEEYWRDSYTDSVDATSLKAAVKSLKAKYRP
jgi:hypothetical protein